MRAGDSSNKKDYNPENVIKGEKRLISFNEINRILKKVDTICKILKGNKEGSGFFCKINIKGKEMKVLFTNNHVLNENKIKQNSIIEIQQNKNIYQIKISEDRFTSANEELV